MSTRSKPIWFLNHQVLFYKLSVISLLHIKFILLLALFYFISHYFFTIFIFSFLFSPTLSHRHATTTTTQSVLSSCILLLLNARHLSHDSRLCYLHHHLHHHHDCVCHTLSLDVDPLFHTQYSISDGVQEISIQGGSNIKSMTCFMCSPCNAAYKSVFFSREEFISGLYPSWLQNDLWFVSMY